jgi:hypothetical protein
LAKLNEKVDGSSMRRVIELWKRKEEALLSLLRMAEDARWCINFSRRPQLIKKRAAEESGDMFENIFGYFRQLFADLSASLGSLGEERTTSW